jgi:hypothetical protein
MDEQWRISLKLRICSEKIMFLPSWMNLPQKRRIRPKIGAVFTFRKYEIYKGKYCFHSKIFEIFFLLKTCFLPIIKSHKT